MSLVPSERHFVLSRIQQTECPAFFHQVPEPSRAKLVVLGFGKWSVVPIGEPKAYLHDRIGRAADDASEAWGGMAQHGSSYKGSLSGSDVTASHSRSFDQRCRPAVLRTAIATALRLPTTTTSRLPRVIPM